jgi:hypothetical protein
MINQTDNNIHSNKAEPTVGQTIEIPINPAFGLNQKVYYTKAIERYLVYIGEHGRLPRLSEILSEKYVQGIVSTNQGYGYILGDVPEDPNFQISRNGSFIPDSKVISGGEIVSSPEEYISRVIDYLEATTALVIKDGLIWEKAKPYEESRK